MTSTSIASPTLTPTPTPPRLTRSRSNSVPTLSHHSSSSPPSKASSTIWQRFKSRNAAAAAITTNIDTDRINLSDESIDEIFGLKSDPSASVFAFATRSFGDSSSFTTSSSSSSHGLNMNMTAQEVQSEEELKLQEALEITERNLDQKIKMWKQIKLPGDDKERLVISILGILSEQTLLVEDQMVNLQNIYCCAWAGSDRRGKQKLHPGLSFLSSKDDRTSTTSGACSDPTVSDLQYFEFFINPMHPPLYFTLEIYGDYVLAEEGRPIHFDQLLFSVILSPDLIPRDGNNLWITSNNISHSVFQKKDTIDIFLYGQLHRRTSSGMVMTVDGQKNFERESSISESNPSTPNSLRQSWSQRFSSVFSRKSTTRESIETTRSMTPPPPSLPPLPPLPSGPLRSSIDLLTLECGGDLPSFSDSDDGDDSSTIQSESTATTTRSVCGYGDAIANLDSIKIDISNHEDQDQDQEEPEQEPEQNQQEDRDREGNSLNEDRDISSSSPLDQIQTLSSFPHSHELELNLDLCLPPAAPPPAVSSPEFTSCQITQLSLKLFQRLCGSESQEQGQGQGQDERKMPHRLGIYCLTPCSTCGECYLDEEILSSWCGLTSSPPSSSSQRSHDLLAIHEISCHKCKHLWRPLLHIRDYEVCHTPTPGAGGAEGGDEILSLEIAWQCDVPYLSPLAIRIMAESLIREHGAVVSDADWLRRMDPVLYWNLIWYTSRFNLPNGLFQNSLRGADGDATKQQQHPPFWPGPISLGWRESTVKAKIRNSILQQSFSASSLSSSSSLLTLRDLFPTITEKDHLAADEMMKDLEHSIPFISNLLKKISSMSSVLQSFSGNKGRQIYLSYLFLLFHYQPASLAKIPDIPYALSKVLLLLPSVLLMTLPLLFLSPPQGSPYDKAFVESISSSFSANDFEKLSTSHTDLMVASTGRSSQAIRIALGMLV